MSTVFSKFPVKWLEMLDQYCYLCQKKSIFAYQLNNRSIYHCLNDDLFFSFDKNKNQPRYDKGYYESSPYNQPQFFNNIYFQNKLNKIRTLMGKKKLTILDVGCGWGNFLEVVKNNNLPYLGIDISSRSVEVCREKKLNCQVADLIDLSKVTNKKYSVITLFQVIEHMKNPLDYLKAAKKLLKINGILLLTTPNIYSPFRFLFGPRWPVFQTPSHYLFYSKKSLKILLKKAGFSKFEIKIDRLRFFSLDYILQRIFKKKLLISRIINFPIPTDPWGDLEVIIINK